MSRLCARRTVGLSQKCVSTSITSATPVITADESRKQTGNITWSRRRVARVRKYERERDHFSRQVNGADAKQQQEEQLRKRGGTAGTQSVSPEVQTAEEATCRASITTMPDADVTAGRACPPESRLEGAEAKPSTEPNTIGTVTGEVGAMATSGLQRASKCFGELDEVVQKGEVNTTSTDGDERTRGGGAESNTTTPDISKPTRPATRRAVAKLAEERRLRKAAKQREARQRKKERRAAASRKNAAARQQHDMQIAISTTQAWQRRDEIRRKVAVGRAQQQARERERERQAAVIQLVWRKVLVRRRCQRPCALCVTQIEKAAAEGRVQRLERDRADAAAVVIQATWRRPVIRARCDRAHALRMGEQRQRERAMRVIGMACHKICKARSMANSAKHRSRETQQPFQANKNRSTKEANVHVMATKAAESAAPAQRGERGKDKIAAVFVEKRQREQLEDMLQAKVEQALRGEPAKHTAVEHEAVDSAEKSETRLAEIRSSVELPPARQNATAATYTASSVPDARPSPFELCELEQHCLPHYVTHPLQLVEGKTLLYDPREFGLWALMIQLQGWSLELGIADVWGGGNEREAEAFSAACGFSAAFGPIVLKVAATAVYGKVFAGGVSVLPKEHVIYAFGQYWEREIAPRDTTERFFGVVKVNSGSGGSSGGIMIDELRPFILAIAARHPDLNALSPDDQALYADTMLTILFYKYSRSRVISLKDLRFSGFVDQMNAVGRLEMDLEDSYFFTWSRQETMRREYLSLCGEDGCGAGLEALSGYRLDSDVRVVGATRASRVIDTGYRQSTSCSSSSSYSSSSSSSCSSFSSVGCGCGQRLGRDAWVCFWLCEEALRSGSCSRKDVRYCFALLDEAGRGRVGMSELTPFRDDTDSAVGFETETAFTQFRHSIGLDRARDYITLKDVTKPANVKRAGRFFGFLFLGVEFEDDFGDVCPPVSGAGIYAGTSIRENGCPPWSRHSPPLAFPPAGLCFSSASAPFPPAPPLPLKASTPLPEEELVVAAGRKSLSTTPPALPTPPLTPPPALSSSLSALSPPWEMPSSALPPKQQQQQQQQQRQRHRQRQRQRRWGERYEHGCKYEYYDPEDDPDLDAEVAAICGR